MPAKKPVRIFYSYSHRDEKYVHKLLTWLTLLKREGIIEEWWDHKIVAGEDIDAEVMKHLEQSQIILLLVSQDFLHSDYCYSKEMKRALAMHDAGLARVIPIIIRPSDWQNAVLARLRVIPKDGKPVVEWHPQDKAWLDVSKEIRNAIANFSDTNDVISVPLISSGPVDPGDPGAPRRTYDDFPARLLEGYLPNTDVQRVSVGRPNEEQDDAPVTLSLALNASNTRIAYTRREPADVYSESRVVAVQEAPNGEWWVHQWRLGSSKYEGVAAEGYSDANMFTIYQLDVPRAAIWWPASGLLSVQYENGKYYPEPEFFCSAGDESVDESGAPPADPIARAQNEPSAARAVLHYLVLRHNPGELAMYQTIEEELDLHGQVLDDALHELKDAGLIEGSGGSGNQFRHVKPLPRAWAAVDKAILGFDIEANKLLIARRAAYESPITAETLEERTGLPAHQLNITALLMREAGELDLFRAIGRSPYVFTTATANHKTRQLLARAAN